MNRTVSLPALAIAVLAGCVQIHTETRVERGPLLRTFEREEPAAPGGIRLRAEARWPRITWSFTHFELCRHQHLEEYAEDHITEKTASSAGPQLATGISTSLAGAGLFLARGLFSNAPNTRTIDGGGNYGASDRTLATGWSYVLLVMGLPALALGSVGLAQTGETTQTLKVDQVVSSKDVPCNERPADGRVELMGPQGPTGKVFTTQGAAVALSDMDLRGVALSGVTLDGKAVELPEEETAMLQQYLACLRVLPEPDPAVLSDWTREELQARLDLARGCASVPEAPAQDAVHHLEKELARRRDGEQEVFEGPRVTSFDEAVAAYQPRLRFAPGGDDPKTLDGAANLVGQAIFLQGVLIERVEANIAVVELSGLRVLVFIPPQAAWSADIDSGARVELVGVVQGRQSLGDIEAPLVRAVWMRPAM